MTMLACPRCAAGTKCLTRITTREGYKWLFLPRYASCACELDTMDRARLIEQAEAETVRVDGIYLATEGTLAEAHALAWDYIQELCEQGLVGSAR